MRCTIRWSLAIFLLMAARAEAAETRWSLPDDPRAIVLQMQHVDSQGRVQETVLTVRRDGSFHDGDAEHPGDVKGRLQEPELLELMREIIDDQQMLEMTTASLSRQVQSEARRTGKDSHIQLAVDVVIRIGLADRMHVVQFTSPGLLRTRYPAIKDMNRLCAVQHRLRNIVATAQVGGKDEAARLAALATEELRRQNGRSVEITPRDLVHVRGSIGDLRQVQFVVESAARDRDGEAVHVSVMEAPGAAPRISLTEVHKPL